ncbi:MAG: murein L,D-transpeptidase [Puniceicoccaceae bacterium]|nr:MAG: murein L,D-transpeptidase [Puniceicoccaceae bacterium]
MSAKKKVSRNWKQFTLGIGCLALLACIVYQWLPLPGDRTKSPPPELPPRAIENILELQIALARLGYSPGSIDGVLGHQSRQALVAYQGTHKLVASGEWDDTTRRQLKIREPVFAYIELTQADFDRIDPPPTSWRERGQRPRMAYHSILEMIAEKSQSDPALILRLNPGLNMDLLVRGQKIKVPYIPPIRFEGRAQHVRISLSERSLQVVDAKDRILFHAPVSIARRVDKRPSGELKVAVRVADPNYTFNPAILSAAAAREGITDKFIIQPGPNNPVGTVWIGLNLPSYGIHGTPEPEQVGRTESSGCFRLANWNAEALLGIVEVGMSVYVVP